MSITTIMRQSKIAKLLYNRIKLMTDFSPEALKSCTPSPSSNCHVRINLVLLGIKQDEVYGGVSTALKVFSKLSNSADCSQRIIITGNQSLSKDTYIPEGFSVDKDSKKEMFFISDGKPLSVRQNDIFIFTYWSTWYTLEEAVRCRNMISKEVRHDIYLIQGFEPGFFAWSTEYMLANSTYQKHSESTIALINSKELASYIAQKGFNFYKMFYFEPRLNDVLLKELSLLPLESKRKRQIIIYGRPSVKRNAFQLIISALRKWSEQYSKAGQWVVLSLGESHKDIKLKNNTVQSYGKLSIGEYANVMSESAIGISLMVSPHPSYPPLEMSTFGLKTITNKFENKDLSAFNSNIVCLDSCSPDDVFMALCRECDRYEDKSGLCSIDLNQQYIEGNSFEEAVKGVAKESGLGWREDDTAASI